MSLIDPRRFDFDVASPEHDHYEPDPSEQPVYSTWPEASHGPKPYPPWLISSANALDTDLGVLKTGKEADVHLLQRAVPGGSSCVLAVKRYRPAERRLFHRDAGYTDGRRVRRSREMRAMARRTEFGRELLSGQWAGAEFGALSRLYELGAPVPYPVQLLGTEVMLEYIACADGSSAPRLAQLRPEPELAGDLFEQCRTAMLLLAREGWAHGDLSAYNLLVQDDRLVMIDLPQIVDIVANPQGQEFLRRDCVNVCAWFGARGVEADDEELFADLIGEAFSRW